MSKKLTITRSRWYRGKAQFSALKVVSGELGSADTGKMCCLGFDAICRGMKPEDITAIGDPQDLASRFLREKETDFFFDEDEVYEFNPPDYSTEYFNSLISVDKQDGVISYIDDKAELINEAIRINDHPNMSEDAREARLIPILKRIGGYDEVEFVD